MTHDVAIIDWMLPGRDGPAVCRAIRSARLQMGLLMLTARTQVEDRVSGNRALAAQEERNDHERKRHGSGRAGQVEIERHGQIVSLRKSMGRCCSGQQ